MKKSIANSLCAVSGALIAVCLDLLLKNDASIILVLGRSVRRIIPIGAAPLLVVIAVLVVAFFLPYLTEVTKRRNAFAAGLGIIATLFTAIPYQAPAGLPSTPSSSLVTLLVNTGDSRPLVIDVTVENKNSHERSSSKYDLKRERKVAFYLKSGHYTLTVKSAGYSVSKRELIVEPGDAPVTLSIKLSPSAIPLNLQQLF